jgi:isocitrate dehydrogenase
MSIQRNSSGRIEVTLIEGDGIGPEVVGAAVRVVEAAGVPIEWDRQLAGETVFRHGDVTGVPPATIESIRRTGVALKGPLATPIGYGEQSANVMLRKLFELYANVRPARELPGVPTPFGGQNLDVIVVRENVEDLYAGIEYMQTPGVAECLKLMTHKGCEKIVRLAFELANAEGRERIHCATKANIMKMTEGLLKRTFERIAPEYPHIKAEHIIIDNCAHMLVRHPEQFELIVTSNMNGDILSDLTSGLAGGLGFAPSANIGNDAVIFEAVHGTAPNIAGKNIVNPTALLLSGVMMLRHLEEFDAADTIENAVLVTLEEGRAVTVDVNSDEPATTTEFVDAIIANFGKKSKRWRVRAHVPIKLPQVSSDPVLVSLASRRVIGVDVFIEAGGDATTLGMSLETICEGTAITLKLIANRGVRVYPPTEGNPDCVDHWRCRFTHRDETHEVTDAQILSLLEAISRTHRWMHIEKLQEFDGKPAFSRAQGEGS